MMTFIDDNGKLVKGRVAILIDAITVSDFISYQFFENGKYLYNSAEPLQDLLLWVDLIIDKRVK
jgi:hypothetical protein